jgi:hypothetical protein
VGGLILIVNGQVILLALGVSAAIGFGLFAVTLCLMIVVAKRAYVYDLAERARQAAEVAENTDEPELDPPVSSLR